MAQVTSSNSLTAAAIYRKETVVDGSATTLECTEFNGQVYTITGNFLKIAKLEDEWYEDVADPASALKQLSKCTPKPDIFTFLQRLPELEPKYPYQMDWESLAVLPVTTFDHWWTKQIRDKTRNMVRKSRKAGIEIREASFDDTFVQGMAEIFNETPIRQGRRFWHYGKDFETIKSQFSRCLFREELIGAYYQEELVGFIMLANAGKYGVLGQIISKIEHRNKAINNALIAKSVEICEQKAYPYLVYGYWNDTSLSDFKKHCGFEEIRLPRYRIPLTITGQLALRLGYHRGWKRFVPHIAREPLKKLRKAWLTISSSVHGSPSGNEST